MSRLRKSLSVFLAVMMVLSVIPFSNYLSAKAVDTTMPMSNYAIVVGDLMAANGYGTDWAPANTKGLMKTYTNGIYETTLDLKPKADGTAYGYKIAMNGSWSESFGSGSDNISLAITKEQKVTFRLDYLNQKVYDSVNNPDQFKTSASLVGTLNNWNPADSNYDLDYVGGGFYTKTFTIPAGSHEYKVAYNHAWSQGEIGSNVALKLDADTQVTFLANPTLGICEDSINHKEILANPSIVGSVRNSGSDATNADATAKGFEFSYLADNGLYAYSAVLPAGTYSYQVANNYSATGLMPASPVSVTVPKDGYVIFVCDEVNGKVYDSINNPDEIANILGIVKPVATYPLINSAGTVTFKYNAPDAKSVYLEGDMTYWADGKKLMTKDSDGNWTITMRVGDAAANLEYMFVVDGKEVTDPQNKNVDASTGHSVLQFPAFKGRQVVLAGTLQMAAGDAGNWNPAGAKSQFTYQGNGVYKLTIKDVPAGDYQYKIAIGGSWAENYGVGGAAGGSNVAVTVPSKEDISFIYDDDNHLVVDTVNNKILTISLNSSETGNVAMTNDDLSGIYKATVTLNKGTYSDFSISYDGKTYQVGNFTVNLDNRKVIVSFDPISKTAFTDISSKDINTSEVYFNSKDSQYKNPYGADTQNTPVTFNLKCAKDDLASAKLVVIDKSSNDSVIIVDMSKNGTFDDTHDKWTCTFTPTEKGLYKYYFVLSNGEQVKAYGDDDGLFGAGKTADIGQVGYYDLNVCEEGFKTPDWLKNAIIYQIFPDRFFDGDTSNDTVEKVARGTTPYEFHDSWYEEPVGANDLFGGDISGITQRLDYLKALGVTTLYLNPISESISSHRYDTTNYEEVDPFLGKLDDFVALINAANKDGMHVLLDSVYNHVSDDSIYFDRYGKYVSAGKPLGAYQYWSNVYDLMNSKNVSQSDAEAAVQTAYKAFGITDFHYKDWFIINNVKDDKGTSSEHYDYSGWNGNDSMPEIQALNGSEKNVGSWKDEILAGNNSNTAYWLNEGANGFRLDAADQVSDDTWATFRDYVKSVSNDDAIVGEIWTDGSKYLLGDEWDSVMNYRYQTGLLDFLRGTKSSIVSANELDLVHEQTPEQAFEAMMNLVGSHDTARIATVLSGDTTNPAKAADAKTINLMKLVALMQMTYPGAPTIYYGDEIGMTGQNDPNCRRAMTWGEGNQSLVERYALLANIRNSYDVLRTGSYKTVDTTSQSDILSYVRSNSTDNALVVVNRGAAQDSVTLNVSGLIPDGTKLYDAAGDGSKAYTVDKGAVTVSVGAVDGLVLVTNYKKVTVNYDALKPAYDSSYKVSARNYETAQAQTTDSLKTVTDAKNNGEAIVDVTSTENNANLVSVALEEGLLPTFTTDTASLSLTDKATAEYINEQGYTSLTFTAVTPNASETSAINKAAAAGGSTVLTALSLSLKANGVDLGSRLYNGACLTTNLGSSFDGKTVYLYYFNQTTGKMELVDSDTVSDGVAAFAIKHLSTYFVTDSEIKVADNNSGNGGSGNGSTSNNTSTSTSTSTTASSTTQTKVSNPSTGAESMPFAPIIVFDVLSIGAFAFIKKKRS